MCQRHPPVSSNVTHTIALAYSEADPLPPSPLSQGFGLDEYLQAISSDHIAQEQRARGASGPLPPRRTPSPLPAPAVEHREAQDEQSPEEAVDKVGSWRRGHALCSREFFRVCAFGGH